MLRRVKLDGMITHLYGLLLYLYFLIYISGCDKQKVQCKPFPVSLRRFTLDWHKKENKSIDFYTQDQQTELNTSIKSCLAEFNQIDNTKNMDEICSGSNTQWYLL